MLNDNFLESGLSAGSRGNEAKKIQDSGEPALLGESVSSLAGGLRVKGSEAIGLPAAGHGAFRKSGPKDAPLPARRLPFLFLTAVSEPGEKKAPAEGLLTTEDDEARDLFGQSGSLSWGSAFPDLGDLQERGFQRAIELDGKIRLGDEISLGSVLEAQLEFRLGEGSLPGDEFRLDSVEDCYEDDELDEDFEGPGESDLPGESELDEGCEGPGERDLLGESELDDGCELDEYCELNEYFLDKDFEYGEDFNFDQNGLFDQKPRFIPKRWQGRYFKVPLENVRLDREMGFRRLGVFAPSDILEMRQQVRDLVAGKLREG